MDVWDLSIPLMFLAGYWIGFSNWRDKYDDLEIKNIWLNKTIDAVKDRLTVAERKERIKHFNFED